MRLMGWSGIVLSAVLITGCATTGRNNQADIDAMNARITALQGQMAEKDEEISKLKNDLSDQSMAREAAESALKGAEAEKRALQAKSSQSAALAAGLK